MNKLINFFNFFCWILLTIFIVLVIIFMLIILPAIASFIFINFIGVLEGDATFIQTFLYYFIPFNIYIFCLMPIVFSFEKIHKIIKTKAFNRKNLFKILILYILPFVILLVTYNLYKIIIILFNSNDI